MSGGRSRRPAPRSRRDWGWHPLLSDWARRVVAASPVSAGDLVLDLGAGEGALTRPLVAAGAAVVAVELNPRRAAALRSAPGLAEGRDLVVVRTDLRELRLPRRPFRVVASPPYSASTDVLRLLLSTDRLLSADLVLQRSAARRLCERPPSARHARRYVLGLGMEVPRRAFAPPPRVDSMVLQVRRHH